ncbi:MAG: transcriptional regulator, RpiR family [Aeromicrobium sp.]|nr:transcriptional regulator, RpiR family [Aeromicrobium sp.]
MSIQSSIQSLAPGLSPVGTRIAAEILARPDIVMDETISQFAVRCQTSEASIVRFCRTLGLTGYSQLRIQLASEIGRETAHRDDAGDPANTRWRSAISPSDSLADAVAKVSFAEKVGLQETIAALDLAVLEKVVAGLVTADRSVMFGVGASALAAGDLTQKLLRIGRVSFSFIDAHEAVATASLLSPGDVAMGFTHSGRTNEIAHFLRTARARGATTVVITNTSDTPATELADLTLFTKVRETVFRSGDMASRIAQLSLVDCMWIGVAQHDHERTTEALATTYDSVKPLRGARPRRAI